MRYGGEQEFEKMLEIYDNPLTGQDGDYCIIALESTSDDSLLERLFSLTLSGRFRDQVSYLILYLEAFQVSD